MKIDKHFLCYKIFAVPTGHQGMAERSVLPKKVLQKVKMR